MPNYMLAGYLNNAYYPAIPEIELSVTDLSRARLRERLSDMHSKGTTLSCAVATENLETLLKPEDLEVLKALLEFEATMGGSKTSNLVQGLLRAGARFALQIPDIETLMVPPEKLVP